MPLLLAKREGEADFTRRRGPKADLRRASTEGDIFTAI